MNKKNQIFKDIERIILFDFIFKSFFKLVLKKCYNKILKACAYPKVKQKFTIGNKNDKDEKTEVYFLKDVTTGKRFSKINYNRSFSICSKFLNKRGCKNRIMYKSNDKEYEVKGIYIGIHCSDDSNNECSVYCNIGLIVTYYAPLIKRILENQLLAFDAFYENIKMNSNIDKMNKRIVNIVDNLYNSLGKDYKNISISN